MVSVPPNAASPPNDSEYTSRAPGKKVLNPALHEPDVYMPLLPAVSVDSCGAEPLVPARGNVLGIPRQMGGDCVILNVAVGVRVMEGLPVAVFDGEPVLEGERVMDGLLVPVSEAVGVPEAVRVLDGLPVPVRVPDTEAVDERVSELEGVPVRVAEILAVDVRD